MPMNVRHSIAGSKCGKNRGNPSKPINLNQRTATQSEVLQPPSVLLVVSEMSACTVGGQFRHTRHTLWSLNGFSHYLDAAAVHISAVVLHKLIEFVFRAGAYWLGVTANPLNSLLFFYSLSH